MLKPTYRRLQQGILWICAWSVTLPVWANLPTPPASDVADSTNDWIDVGGNLAYKSMRYTCLIVGVMLCVGAAFGIFRAFGISQEKQEMSHFFKQAGMAVAAAAMGAGLIWAGYSIMPAA